LVVLLLCLSCRLLTSPCIVSLSLQALLVLCSRSFIYIFVEN
jgi:hypothetical protein